MKKSKKNVDAEHIKMTEPYPTAPKSYFFEKTPDYFLNNQIITVPDNYVARIFFKYDNPRTVTKCTEKRLSSVTKLRGDRSGEEFFVIFESKLLDQLQRKLEHKWCAGEAPVRYSRGVYNVASQGSFVLELTDVRKFIDASGNGEPGQYNTLSVSDKIIKKVESIAKELLVELFKNVNVFLSDVEYLTDEYNMILESYFEKRQDIFFEYGLKLLTLKAYTITVSPLQIANEKKRLKDLEEQQKERRIAEEECKALFVLKDKRKSEEEKKLREEEKIKEENSKKDSDAASAQYAAQRAEDAAKAAMKNVTQFIESAKKSEARAMQRADNAEKALKETSERMEEAQKVLKETEQSIKDMEKALEEAREREAKLIKKNEGLEHLVNAYKTAKAAAKASSDSTAKTSKAKKS